MASMSRKFPLDDFGTLLDFFKKLFTILRREDLKVFSPENTSPWDIFISSFFVNQLSVGELEQTTSSNISRVMKFGRFVDSCGLTRSESISLRNKQENALWEIEEFISDSVSFRSHLPAENKIWLEYTGKYITVACQTYGKSFEIPEKLFFLLEP